MPAPLAHVDAKIERAKEHIRQLEAAIKLFAEAHPYQVVAEDDPDTGGRLFRVRVVHAVPVQWATIIGDIVHNLRSSLDVLIWQLVFALTGKRPGRWAKFPFAESVQKFEESENLRKIQGASETAVRLIEATKPYRGGNDALWALHALDVADKHHVSLPVATIVHSTMLKVGNRFVALPWGRLTPMEDGAVLIRFAGDRESYVDMNPNFALQITFGQGQIVEGKAVLPTLFQLAEVTEGTVQPFRALFP